MAESEKVYSFLNDFLFKLVFGKKSHEHLTIRLLNSLLQLDKNNEIKELEFLRSPTVLFSTICSAKAVVDHFAPHITFINVAPICINSQ